MTQILANLDFNKEPSYYMHIDLNSCFATIEQQANVLLRNKPIAVAAYNSPKGVILAPSIEAKKLGIKTGFRVYEAQKICPKIVVLEPDPEKYRYVHHKLNDLLSHYTNNLIPKSVDEFVLDFKDIALFKNDLHKIGKDIKEKIKTNIGDYLTVSIGISKNKFLAKTASNLKKPDGLEEINELNYLNIYKNLYLTDLCGIANRTMSTLNTHGIYTVLDFYNATPYKLKNAFRSILGYYWYLKLRGYEIEDYKQNRKSFGQQYALFKPLDNLQELSPIFTKLIEKMGFRLRTDGYKTQGINLALVYEDHTYWHKGKKTKYAIYDSRDLYKEFIRLYLISPKKKIKLISVSCFNLKKASNLQLNLFENFEKKENLTKKLDQINHKWGKFIVSPASIISKENYVPDRIGFGSV